VQFGARPETLAEQSTTWSHFLAALNGGEARERFVNLRINWGSPIPPAHKRQATESEKTRERECLLEGIREYVDSWLDAGRSFREWMLRFPRLFRRLSADISEWHLSFGCDSREHAFLTPGAQRIGSTPSPDTPDWVTPLEAARTFTSLITSPLADDVRRCDRCGRYFLNRSGHRNKRFCARRCATQHTAIKATLHRRRAERERTLKRARAALRDMLPEDFRRADWKKRVARRTGLTPNWLTRAINRGDLKVPYQVPEGEIQGRR